MKASSIHLLINYSVRDDKSADNEAMIKNLIGHFRNSLTEGISHMVYKTGKRNYTHICYFSSELICDQVTNLPVFTQFLDNLERIADQEPIVADIEQMGYYIG
ncbi:hypothetical protein [Chitinophaga niabensis]|uniref:Uncharacterized protein n=1 Tax=Chitinophaga niabensis TaxID=536979 RepID=A0A1N6J058_9BACT|nr:hypothetical protein [Chitinophaga niabensis]SIO37627.1 hypothetical protein SAMN04488055_3506 [Chitinophaga niabensis]